MTPSNSQITVSRKDERTITVPVASSMNDLRDAATDDDDWRLKSASTITSGHQRDPYVTGVRLTFERVG